MTGLKCRYSLIRLAFPALAGAFLGGFFGFAAAQDSAQGELDTECNTRCTANGYDGEFCGQVCWVPDPAMATKGDDLDWKCMTGCRERGGRAQDCMTSCRRR